MYFEGLLFSVHLLLRKGRKTSHNSGFTIRKIIIRRIYKKTSDALRIKPKVLFWFSNKDQHLSYIGRIRGEKLDPATQNKRQNVVIMLLKAYFAKEGGGSEISLC